MAFKKKLKELLKNITISPPQKKPLNGLEKRKKSVVNIKYLINGSRIDSKNFSNNDITIKILS